jgi:uncharacterized protein (DUF2062 family)
MSKEHAKQSLMWVLLKIRPLLRWIRGFRGSPEAIAGGFSLGIFLALTPTVGVQLVIAVFLATVLKVSRPAALIAVMITNPVTVPPIFTFNYWVGSFFLDGPSVAEVYRHFIKIAAQMAKLDIWEVGAQIRAFAETGQEMLGPLLLGSLIVALSSGIISYYILLRLFRFLMFRRHRRKGAKDTKVL